MSNNAELPVELVLSGRELTEPRLSPNGASIAFVQRWKGATAICEVDVEGRSAERAVSFGAQPAPGRGLGGGCFCWLPDGEGIVYAAADGELWRIAGADLERLTDLGRSCRAPVAHGASVVYVIDEAEVWWQELTTGRSSRLDDGRHEFCFDPAISPDGSTVSWLGWSPPAMAWDAAERVDCRLDDGSLSAWRPDGAAVQQPRFAPDGTPTCVHDGSGWLNVHVGHVPIVAEPVEHAGPTWGMGQRSYVVMDAGQVVFTRNRNGFGSLCIVDHRGGVAELASGPTAVHGQLTAAGDRVAALRSGPGRPPEIVVFAPQTARGAFRHVVATSGVAAWGHVEVPDPQPVTVAVDGWALHARRYVTGHGRLLCCVHGGPTDQWMVDFRPRVAYWRSRGWDVLVVDPRGSTGHGRAYQQALNGSWGRMDVDDAAEMIRHAHEAGWSTPDRTVVMGGSSGGLTVLGLLADHPGLVAGGVASYPVSDLADLAVTSHRFEAHYTDTLVGPIEDVERFEQLSPLHRADRIAGPLLLFHGTDDPVVPVAQSDLLVERIRAAGGEVDYVVYVGEGHGFRDPGNQRDEYERTERFLATF